MNIKFIPNLNLILDEVLGCWFLVRAGNDGRFFRFCASTEVVTRLKKWVGGNR